MTQWLLAGVLLAPLAHSIQGAWLQGLLARQALLLSLSLAIGFVFCGLWIGALALAAVVVWLFAGLLHHAAKSAGNARVRGMIWPAVLLAAVVLGWTRTETFVTQWTATQSSILTIPPLIALVGTSYFLLRALSLCFDARKGKLNEAPELLTTLNFLLFFPTLVSGPLDRYGRFRQDLVAPKTVDARAWDQALWRGVLGLFKKFVLANTLALYALPVHLNALESLSMADAWVAFYVWALVIYLDFSGYCDVAISVGRLLGFSVPENFRSPYFARSITEFWRRWHISLSEWLRDYVFLPSGLALTRRLKGQSLLAGCVAALFTFSICGLWHGFEIHFLAWGLMHGGWVFAHKYYQDLSRSRLPKGWLTFTRQSSVGHALCVLLTFHGVALSWVLFAAPDLQTAAQYIGVMLGVQR